MLQQKHVSKPFDIAVIVLFLGRRQQCENLTFHIIFVAILVPRASHQGRVNRSLTPIKQSINHFTNR